MQQQGNDQTGTWKFHNEEEATGSLTAQQANQAEPEKTSAPVSWTASEYISHQRDSSWYFLLFLGLAALTGLIYFFTGDVVSIVTIVIVVVLYLIITVAKPKLRSYKIDGQGISIDDKFYPFSNFKSFAITQEGAIGSITLLPLKRLLPEISIYFTPEDSPNIIELLAGSLPNDQRQERGVDRLMKRLHF